MSARVEVSMASKLAGEKPKNEYIVEAFEYKNSVIEVSVQGFMPDEELLEILKDLLKPVCLGMDERKLTGAVIAFSNGKGINPRTREDNNIVFAFFKKRIQSTGCCPVASEIRFLVEKHICRVVKSDSDVNEKTLHFYGKNDGEVLERYNTL